MEKLLKLVGITEPKQEKQREDGKPSRLFYQASFQDPANPFAREITRNFWQQYNTAGEPVWKGANPTATKAFINKTIPGQIVSAEVVPYEIEGTDGVKRTVNTYTTVVLGHENIPATFKALNHPLAEANTTPAKLQPSQQFEGAPAGPLGEEAVM